MRDPVITVLGGSSPFTAALVDAFFEIGERLPRARLVLHGRNVNSLELLTRYASARMKPFGWTASQSTQLEHALDGADIVLHQIRYGDLKLRGDGEKLCARLQIVADETLGPAALLTGIKMVPDLEETSRAIARYCPQAWVLNLSNPLSSVTTAMIQFGAKKCIGLCELPLFTKNAAAQLFEIPPQEMSWSYAGLNHRGFIHRLEHNSQDYLAKLPQRLGEQDFHGISPAEIQQLQAIPLKYFQLVHHRPVHDPGRADYLVQLRNRILDELAQSETVSPPSLNERYLEWYPQAVVPVIEALYNSQPSVHVVNMLRDDGLVTEGLADISNQTIQMQDSVVQNKAVEQWIDRFEKHERLFLQTMLNPSLSRVCETLENDPVIPEQHVQRVADELWEAVSGGES